MEDPFKRFREKKADPIDSLDLPEKIKEDIRSAVLVVYSSNARDADLDDAELIAEMRRVNPEAAKYHDYEFDYGADSRDWQEDEEVKIK